MRIGKRSLEDLAKRWAKGRANGAPVAREIVWDDELAGFGMRRQTVGNVAIYVLKYRVKGAPQQRWVTLGEWPAVHPDAARDEAQQIRQAAALGRDLVGERRLEATRVARELEEERRRAIPLSEILAAWRVATDAAMVATPAAGLTRSFDEADAFAAALLGGQFDLLPVCGDPFAATLRLLRVGDMVVQRATTSAHRTRGGIVPGIAVVMVNLLVAERPARINGMEVGIADAILLGGGAELTGYNPRRLDWAALALPLPLLEELAELVPLPLRIRGTSSLLAVRPDRAARLAGALSAAGRVAEDLPTMVNTPDCASNLAMALREEIAAALTAEAEIRPRPRAVGRALRIVAVAEAFMDAQVARPVGTKELCAALGVSARRLHDAFRAALGMSPHAYLKSRRLMLVHRALLGRPDGPELVKSVALGHGFWHLGHFARDYRDLFGELPSATLASRGAKGAAHGLAQPTIPVRAAC